MKKANQEISGENPVISVIPNENLRHHMILPDMAKNQFDRITKEYAARDRLAHHGLQSSQKILLSGPTGSGKTMAAEQLAWHAGLTLCKVSLDSIQPTHPGWESISQRELLAITETPCLL